MDGRADLRAGGAPSIGRRAAWLGALALGLLAGCGDDGEVGAPADAAVPDGGGRGAEAAPATRADAAAEPEAGGGGDGDAGPGDGGRAGAATPRPDRPSWPSRR